MLYQDLIWKGRSGAELGVMVTGPVSYQRPAKRREAVTIPGRSGTVALRQGNAWEEVIYSPDCAIRPGFDRDAVWDWLQGCGRVCFGSMSEYAFEARLTDGWTTKEPTPGHPGGYVLFTPLFVCQPYRYEAVPLPPYPLDGMTRRNPGNQPAAPLIRLTAGSGTTVRLAAGGRELTVRCPASGGKIVIDAEAEASSCEGSRLSCSGEYPLLPVGYGALQMTLLAGTVTEATVEPRYRWI